MIFLERESVHWDAYMYSAAHIICKPTLCIEQGVGHWSMLRYCTFVCFSNRTERSHHSLKETVAS